MQNKKAILKVPGKIELKSAEFPIPKEDDVVLKVEYVGICGSDIHSFESGPFIPPKEKNQEIGLGHECAGTVVQVGANVKNLQVGDKACIEPGIPCGKCRFCLEGKYNICPEVNFMATYPSYRGALTKYLSHPAKFTYKLPDAMDTLEGAMIEPASVGVHATLMAEVKLGNKIIILGAGCIGLMTLQACRSMGAAEIIVIDIIDKRLELAKKLGASEIINSTTDDIQKKTKMILGDLGADIIFETAGAQATAKMATNLVMRGGKIMIVGTIPGETPINFLKINREVTIQTVFRYANCYQSTIDAITYGSFDVKSMVTNIYPLKDVQMAFEESINKKSEIIKSVIKITD